MESDTPNKFKPQRVSYFNDALVVHLVDFPIFYIECISERHFVVAGGGGASKTGVHNQINILELVPTGDSCAADLMLKYKTPEEVPDAIMTGSLMRDLPIISTRLVTGGRHPTIYSIGFDPTRKSFNVEDFEILRDKQKRAELKCIKYAKGQIFTGGIDGQLTVWNVGDELKEVAKEIRAHQKAIDEIDLDLIKRQIVTLCREEGKCSIWSLANLKLIQEFNKDFINQNEPPTSKYSYRSCKYAYDTISLGDQKKDVSKLESYLLVACNAVPKTGPSKLYKWSTSTLKNPTSIPLGMEGVMAMTVSLDGKFVAVGTRAGSVQIHEVENLKQIYKIDGAHYNIVTGLEFLAPIPESLSLTNSKTCALLSVSIDRRIVIHRPRRNSLLSRLFTLVIMAILMFITFFFIYNV